MDKASTDLKFDKWMLVAFASIPISVVIAGFARAARLESLFNLFWVDRELAFRSLNLNFNFPVLLSTLFLLSAGFVWIWVGNRTAFQFRLSATVFGGFIVVMGIDELFSVHERVEAASGVDWQLIYLPIVMFGALTWGNLVIRMKRVQRGVVVALVLGVALWGISQVLEFVQWDGGTPRPGYAYMVMVEEVLESWGSLLFLQAGILALRSQPRLAD